MPVKNITSKRPSSPYQTKKIQSRNWRSLSGTGFAHVRYPQLEDSKAAWLKSLRLGTAPSLNQNKPLYGSPKTQQSVNLALASSSEFLKEQLGLSLRTESSSSRPQSAPGTPRYKPQEDMYDEIIELKKIIQNQKLENDQMKAKLRYNEEENIKKDKCITELLDQALMIHTTKRTPKGDQVVINTLKNQRIKSSRKIESLEIELKDAKSRHKKLKTRVKDTKLSYTSEVKNLQEAIMKQNQEIKLLSGDVESEEDDEQLQKSRFATNIKNLRSSVVKLTAENCQLKEDNRCLRKDLQQAMLDKDENKDSTDKQVLTYSEKIERMKSTINRLRDERSNIHNENNKKLVIMEHLEEELEKLKEENLMLKNEIEKSTTFSAKRKTSSSSRSSSRDRKINEFQQKRAASKIQNYWRSHRSEKAAFDDDIVLIQSTIRAHTARQDCLDQHKRASSGKNLQNDDEEEEIYSGDEDHLELLQSVFRGHLSREAMLQSSQKKSHKFT